MKKPGDDILRHFGLEDDKLLQEVLSGLDGMKVKGGSSKQEAWQRLEQSIKLQPQVKTVSYSVRDIAWKVAASVLVIVSLWLGFNAWNNVSYTTANNQVKEIILPDQSKVTLNAASTLSFHKFRWKSSRKVILTGEGFFKVTKGNSFEISSNGNKIKVLGTEFNVYSRKDYFEVRCISGKVEVRIPNEEKVILGKGNAVRKQGPDQAPQQFKISNAAGWIRGDFYYDRADLQSVLDEIARQYNVHVQCKIATNREYSGYFNKSGLNQALRNICLPLGLTFRISNDTVTIEKGH